jgi:N-acetylmuramoyl-L-alanine amidase
VQIGANTVGVEPTASNFKGLKDVRREKSDKYFRYYVGRESSFEKIEPLLQKIQLKFSQAFIVSFVDGKRIIINNQSK